MPNSVPVEAAKEPAMTAIAAYGRVDDGAPDDESAPKVGGESSKKTLHGDQPAEATPMLDVLPSLRRAQYL